jgi:transposase-like protein
MDTHLGYEKDETKAKSTPNSRNGKSKKTVTSEYGEQEIAVPRDRLGEFEPLVVKKHQSNVTGIEDQFVALYAKGVTTREIQDHLQNLYGIEVSPTLISNVTNKVVPLIKEWQTVHFRASMQWFFSMPFILKSSRTDPLSIKQLTWSLVSIFRRKQGRAGHVDRRK